MADPVSPEVEAFMDALLNLAAARARGQVCDRACQLAAAAVVLALEVDQADLRLTTLELANEQTARTLARLAGGARAKGGVA